MAFCEQFPRPLGGYSNVSIAPLSLVKQGLLQVLTPDQLQTVEVLQMAAGVSNGDTFVEYWAQVGKASNMLDNYDNIFSVSKALRSFDAAHLLLITVWLLIRKAGVCSVLLRLDNYLSRADPIHLAYVSDPLPIAPKISSFAFFPSPS